MAQFWKSLRRRLAERNNSRVEESTCVNVDYLNLEPRRVLSADFMLVGGVLDLDDFSQTTDENLSIARASNLYQFELDEGVWSGVDTTFLSGNGTSTLLVDPNFVTDISVNDNLGIALDVEFHNIDLSQLNSTSIVTSGNIGQSVLSAVVAPTLSLTGNDIDLSNAANDFGSISLVAAGELEIADANDLMLTGLQADRAAIIAGQAGPGLMTLDGDVVVADQLLLQSSDGVQQIGGLMNYCSLATVCFQLTIRLT
jgi:hypothetical protein